MIACRYQREGVEFGVKRNAKVILADEMGLGKTVQVDHPGVIATC